MTSNLLRFTGAFLLLQAVKTVLSDTSDKIKLREDCGFHCFGVVYGNCG